MDTQTLRYTVTTVATTLIALLHHWTLLLIDRVRQPLWILIGTVSLVGGLLNFRRIRITQRAFRN